MKLREKGKEAFRANMNVLTDEEVMLGTTLVGAGQGHLMAHWPPPGLHDDDKRRFLSQIASLEKGYPGGVGAYVSKARELLLRSRHGLSSNKSSFVPEPPSGFSLEAGSKEMLDLEKEGYAAMHTCAFVLVAGGLGERLGYSGIKVALPAEITTGGCFLKYYIENVLALEGVSDMSPGQHLPLIIMTSPDTHHKTNHILARNNFFGAEPGQVTLLEQQNVPAVADEAGHLSPLPDDPYQVLTKPHGHGDVHRLLHTSGAAQRLADQGYRWVYVFQDTNALGFKALAACLGLSVRHSLDVNTMAVPRRAGDACGALMSLRRGEGSLLINNVEYNELPGVLQGLPDLDPTTGYSPYPGNTNQIIFKLSSYVSCLRQTQGMVPEFVNPKYADKAKGLLAAPTRIECMLQDFPKLLNDPGAKVSFVQLERWLSYTPIKNSLSQGAVLAGRGLPAMTSSTGEADLYYCNRHLLRLAGMQVSEGTEASYAGLQVVPGPRVVFAPSFAVGVGDVLHKVKGGRMTGRSTLLVSGRDVVVEDLDLDGTLILRAVPGARVKLKGLKVRNRGWSIEQLKAGGSRAPEELRVRGYQLVKYEQRVIEFSEPGDFECSA